MKNVAISLLFLFSFASAQAMDDQLFQAIQNNPNALKALVECGARINAENTAGETPLQYAKRVNPGAIKALIDCGAK